MFCVSVYTSSERSVNRRKWISFHLWATRQGFLRLMLVYRRKFSYFNVHSIFADCNPLFKERFDCTQPCSTKRLVYESISTSHIFRLFEIWAAIPTKISRDYNSATSSILVKHVLWLVKMPRINHNENAAHQWSVFDGYGKIRKSIEAANRITEAKGNIFLR